MATIRSLYSIKNTMGYGLNCFVDHDRAVDILEHLVIGSEGTLAFVAEATFRTVPVRTHVATGLLRVPRPPAATAALPALVAAGFADHRTDGRRRRCGSPSATRSRRRFARWAVTEHAALLVEFQETPAMRWPRGVARAPRLLRPR